jgi:antitoxin PrlF
MASRLTSKGQVTIPKPVRDRLGLRPGDEVAFVEGDDGVRVEKLVADSPFASYRGYLRGLAGRDPDRVVGEMRGD